LNLNFKTKGHWVTWVDSKYDLFQLSTLCRSLKFKSNETFVLFGKCFQLNSNFMTYIGTMSYYKTAMLSHKVSWWLGYCHHRLSYSPFSSVCNFLDIICPHFCQMAAFKAWVFWSFPGTTTFLYCIRCIASRLPKFLSERIHPNVDPSVLHFIV
jgi:hypothetical protein